MIKDIKMRLVALIEESYYSQNDKVFKVINFLPDIKVEKVIENGIHKQDNGIYYFDINKEQDPVQIPYTNNIKDLSVIIGQNGSGKTMTINKILREDNRETLVHLIFERNGSLYTYPNFKQESISFKQSNIHPYIIKFSNAKEFSNNDKPIRPGAIDASDFKNILLFNNSVLKSNEEKIIFLQETINQIKFIEEFKYKINQFVDYTTKGITVNFQSNNLAYNTNQLVFVDSMEKSNAEQNPINTRIVDYFSALINHITDNYSTNIKIKDIEKLLDHHLSLWNDNFNNQNNQNLQRALSEIIEYPYNTYSIYDIKILYSLFIFHIYSYYIKNNNGQYNKYKNKLISIIKENRTIYGNNLNKREINKKLLNRYFESKNAINYLDVSLYNLESITPNAEYFTKWENIWRQIEKQCITVASGELGLLKSFANLYLAKQSIERKTAQGVQRKNLLLLLDEIDLGLHPEWQRKWVSTALPIIEKIFEDKHLQIIITSHSPIFLSDIYKENIIFLTKENEREKEKIFEKTFGQNIYTLFKNSFFLQDVMGEYAYNTIKDTIEFLTLKINPTDRSLDSNSLFNRLDETKRKKTAKKIIDSVGEPIIANQLKELFYKAFPNKNDEISEIQNKIYQLQNRIRQLEEERSQ